MDKKYWKNYYEKQKAPVQASLFAQHILENYVKENDSLIELGCGNGRDSAFFALHGVNVVAIDQCENEIFTLSVNNKLKNIKFICDDFTKLGEIGSFDSVYSRFTLHSITEKEENDTIKWAYEHLKKNGKLLVEARGKKNELYKLGIPIDGEKDVYVYEEHSRRFVDIDNLCDKLTKMGFNLVSAEEKASFAPFGDTNYVFMRIVALKD